LDANNDNIIIHHFNFCRDYICAWLTVCE